MAQGEYCECVVSYLCDYNTKRIIDTGSGLVRWRYEYFYVVSTSASGLSPFFQFDRTGGSDTPKKCDAKKGEVCCKPPLWAEKIEGTPPVNPSQPDIESSSDINHWNLPTLPDPEDSSSQENPDYNQPSPVNENFPEDNPDQDINGHIGVEPNPQSGNNVSPPLRCGERRPQTVDYRQTALRVSGADEGMTDS